MKKFILLAAFIAGIVRLAAAQQADRIGYANLQYIMAQLPEMKQIQADMKSAGDQFRNQIQEKSQKLQQQYNDFNQNTKEMADTARERKQGELQQAMSELQKFQQDAQVTLENKEKLYMAPLYLKVNKVISDVAKENGFAIILTDKLNNFSVLLYQQPQDDVSDLVLKKMGVTPPAK
jgi:outer membrane protein